MAKEAIFFDDLQENIDNVGTCVGIEAVKVSAGTKAPNPETADENFYAAYLATKGMSIQYYEGSGLGLSEIPAIRVWLANIPQYAIFDWDQTLTQCAGLFLPVGDANNTDYSLLERFALDIGGTGLKVPDDAVEQTLNYLFGGPRRLVLIRRLMQSLNDRGVDIIILTNNAASLSYQFTQLMEELLGDISFRIICSARGTPANGDKRLAIEMDEELGLLCGLAATMPPKGSGMLTATTPSRWTSARLAPPKEGSPSRWTYKRGGTRRKHKRRTIKLRRFMRRLKATRHRRNGTRSRLHKP